MTQEAQKQEVQTEKARQGIFSGWIIFAVFVALCLVAVLVVRYYFWPSPYKPTELSQKEELILQQKIKKIIPGFQFDSQSALAEQVDASTKSLTPQPYSEEGADRLVSFSEREINALLAKNTDLADKLAIDFSNDLVSATLLVPVEEGFPILGGKTVRINTGMGLAFTNNRLIAVLKGVSVMGVPLPSSWLGGLKNIDLVEQFDEQGGFWERFADGIVHLSVQDNQIEIELAE